MSHELLESAGELTARASNPAKPLCSDCKRLITWVKRSTLQENDYIKFQFKPNHKVLRLSALDCAVCDFVLHKVFDGHIWHKGWDDETTISYTVSASPHGDLASGLTEIVWEETLPFPSPSISVPALYYLANPDLAGKRAVWRRSAPTFDSRFETVVEWISHCDGFHSECISSPTALPRRLVDVSDLKATNTVRLIESSSIVSTGPVKYATLSHCWGPPSAGPPLRTTKASYAEHMRGIALSGLTLNFHDAVLICGKLGLRYIWIDSLCIIQDDPADWEVEAAKMADVYRGGYINIAVNAASDAHGGIINLTSLAPPENRLHTVRYADRSNTGGGGHTHESLVFQSNHGAMENRKRSVRDYPYLGRGWVFQELALSPRSIHFLRAQMFWQCRHCFTSEDGTMWDPAFGSLAEGSVGGRKASFETSVDSHSTWSWWIEAYSKRIFTFDSDVAPAMAGMINYFASITRWQPLLGLWRETLAMDLGWELRHSATRGPSKQQRPSNLPSWSWLSVLPLEDRQRSLRGVGWVEQRSASLRLEHWEENWVGVPFTSRLESSRLVVSAFVRDLSILVGSATKDYLLTATRPDWEGSSCYCALDFADPRTPRVDAKVVQLYQRRLEIKATVSFTDCFLIVMPCPERPGCFSRIGVGDVKVVIASGLDEGEDGHFGAHFTEKDRQIIELI